MQVFSNVRRLTRLSKPSSLLLNSSSSAAAAAVDHRPSSSDSQTLVSPPHTSHQCDNRCSFSHFSGSFQGNHLPTDRPLYTRTLQVASISTESTAGGSAASEAVKELYDKIIESVRVKRTMAPNAWLWSLIENCKNREDVKLLFYALQNLRIFRMSSLRIHSNFNCNLCREVTKACVRAGAIDFGKKTLSKHNVYGLAPTIGSANHLLSYAKEGNDAKLMTEVMKLMKVNDVPLQAGTADIVFSICYELDNWELISKYSKRFLKGGVKLRKTAFDIWMDFAARRGPYKFLILCFYAISNLSSFTCLPSYFRGGLACWFEILM
uniref:Uncharacterized protein MANES_15G016200 n=1 Tax=Rhizophora mucronata TaxID=61149 RepID=A0A2P2LT29_RHIMU